MKHSIQLSVITPVYNGARFIEACLENVRSQNCPNVEHLIVDGGSTDGTIERVVRFAEKYPHVRLDSARDQGQSDAMNRGIALARGHTISFLNVDDAYLPGALNEAMAELSRLPAPAFVVGNCQVVDAAGRELYTSIPDQFTVAQILMARPCSIYPINPASYFYHKSLHDLAGGYDVSNRNTMDLDFLLRAFQHVRPTHVSKVWATFSLNEFSKTAIEIHHGRLREHKELVYRKFRKELPAASRARIATYRFVFRIAAALQMARQNPKRLVQRALGKSPPANMDTLFSSRLRHWIVRVLSRRPLPLLPRRYKAAIYKVDRIGDFVLASSAIRQLVDHFGEQNCVLVIAPHALALAKQEFPHCSRIVVRGFPGRLLRDFAPKALVDRWKFSRITCESLICLRHQRAVNHAVSLSWIRAKRSFGFENDPRCELKTEEAYSTFKFDVEISNQKVNFARADEAGDCSELERHRLLVETVVGRSTPASEIIPSLRASPSLLPSDFLLVCPFGTQSIRSLPTPTLVIALLRIQKSAVMPIRLSGSPDQKEALTHICDNARAAGVVDIALHETASFAEFRRAVEQARVVLTAETAGAHLAAALDRPAVIVIGGGHYGIFAPWKRSERQIWLTSRQECFGCDWRCSKPEPLCITEVAPHKIADSVLALNATEVARISPKLKSTFSQAERPRVAGRTLQ